MKYHSKFTSRQHEQHQQEQTHGQEQKHTSLEFANVEEMFRHDALHTPVPPAIEVRLQKSIADLPAAPALPWWKRILGS